MITGGIDMGLENIKAVVLKDGKVIGKACGHAGGVKRPEHAAEVWKAALSEAGVKEEDVSCILATGKGKYDVPFAKTVYTEPVCMMKAASALNPEASMVMSLGADETLIVTLKDGKINETTFNQKCSAGIGIMLEVIADRLGISMEELGKADVSKAAEAKVSDGCMVFAEMDALSLLNKGVSKEAVAAAAVKSAAVRTSVVFEDVTYPDKRCVVLIGALAKAPALVAEVEKISDVKFVIPEDPVYYLATGAAVMAASL